MNKIKVGIAGCMGRMGKDLVRAVCSKKNMVFIGGFEKHGNKSIGKKIGELINVKNNSIIYDNPKKIFYIADVVIDFTTPESTLENIKFANKYSPRHLFSNFFVLKNINKPGKDNIDKIIIGKTWKKL